MRIFAGTARGRFVNAPPNAKLRPTTDRVRLAVFNATAGLIPGCRYLDLFCGSGSMGLEALSRGAAHVTFVDSQRACVDALKESARGFGFADAAWDSYCADYRRALASLAARGAGFDLAYLDPPYDAGLGADALATLVSLKLMAVDARVRILLEHSSEQDSPAAAGLALCRRYDHGAASVSVYGPALPGGGGEAGGGHAP
jgi:16S rRNA (guanine966-N2)-methyltransferase